MRRKKKEEIKEDHLGAKEMAAAIRKIDKAVSDLKKSGLRNRTIILLISDASGVGRGTVSKVLEGMEEMKERYLVS